MQHIKPTVVNPTCLFHLSSYPWQYDEREHKQKAFSTFRKLGICDCALRNADSRPEWWRLKRKKKEREEKFGSSLTSDLSSQTCTTDWLSFSHWPLSFQNPSWAWEAALQAVLPPGGRAACRCALQPSMASFPPLCHHRVPQRARWMPLPPVCQAQQQAATPFISFPLEDLHRSIKRTTVVHNEALKTEC